MYQVIKVPSFITWRGILFIYFSVCCLAGIGWSRLASLANCVVSDYSEKSMVKVEVFWRFRMK
jgi:hypothetical protein